MGTRKALRGPVVAAKTIATLDWQSNGRLELGVGYGWNEEELATHGVTLADAPDRLADHLALMKELWTNDEGSHAGPFVSVETSPPGATAGCRSKVTERSSITWMIYTERSKKPTATRLLPPSRSTRRAATERH